MSDKVMYIPYYDTQSYPICTLQLMVDDIFCQSKSCVQDNQKN